MSSFRSVARATASALALTGAVLVASLGLPARSQAAEPSHHEKMMKKMTPAEFMKMDPAECMKMMDQEHKGHVTKKEFLKFQEQLFDNIPKSKADRVTHEEWLNQIHASP